MKKCMFIVVWMVLAVVAVHGQKAQLTSPKANDSWVRGTVQTISWTWSGVATVKLVLADQNKGSTADIAAGLALNAGSFSWTVGMLKSGKSVPAGSSYQVRMLSMPDGKQLAASPLFAIQEPAGNPTPPEFSEILTTVVIPLAKSIAVSRPAKGETWIPLKTYTVKWTWTVPEAASNDLCFGKYECTAGCPVDLWVAPAANPNSGEKVYLKKECCSLASYGNGMVTYTGEYSGIVPNLQSGDYIVRVARNDKPGFFGTSQPFTVKSTLSPDSATLVPDATQGQSDLALTDVFFDNAGNIAIKVKNMGDSYHGSLGVQYKFITIGSSNETLKDEKNMSTVSFQPGEEQKMVLCYWGGFTFSRKGWNGGSPSKGIPSRFIPENSRPFQATVTIKADNDINSNNDWASKRMCMIQDADIGTDGQIRLDFTPKNSIYIAAGTANQVPVEGIQWTADKEFTATLEVFIWNYGCAARSFDCLLFVDDLPGQRVAAGLSLQPGERVQWQQQVKIKVPSRCGDHKLVFIADPKEYGHEPYPNSYQNNFIPVTLKIICNGTITDSGW